MPERRGDELPVEDVPTDQVQFGLSPRTGGYDADHVAALAEVLRDVPPILVHAPTMRVVDGVHRVLAARRVGQPTIRAAMLGGDEINAHAEAVRANIAHGKPLSLAEREAAAARFLEVAPEWSDRRIASISGLSPKTVGRLRLRATVDVAQLRARLGRDGKMRPIDPTAVRRRVSEVVATEPDASNRAIARRTGASQATVRDVRQRLGQEGMPTPPDPPTPTGPPAGRDTEAAPEPAVAATAPRHARAAAPAELDAWLEQHDVDQADWRRFVDAVPISRVYEVADACRRRSESWRAFAVALEDRARSHRRSSNATGGG